MKHVFEFLEEGAQSRRGIIMRGRHLVSRSVEEDVEATGCQSVISIGRIGLILVLS